MNRHFVTLAIEVGLEGTPNGDLIRAAEAQGFDALITPDKNLGYEQDLRDRQLAIVVLPSGRWPEVRDQLQEGVEAIDGAQPGSYREISYRKTPKP